METKEKPKAKPRARATIKQKRAIAALVENGGNVSAAMLQAGYSPATAHNPDKLTDSKGYQDLIEEYLPDLMLLETHRNIINSPRLRRTFMKGAMMEEIEETDPAQVRGLDMAYKLKGKYTDGPTTNVLIVQLSGTAASRYAPDTSIEESAPPSV